MWGQGSRGETGRPREGWEGDAQTRREAWAWTWGCGRGGRPRRSSSCRETRTPSDGGKEAPRPQSEVSSCRKRQGAGRPGWPGEEREREVKCAAPSSPSRCSQSRCAGLSGIAVSAPVHTAPGRPLGMGGESRRRQGTEGARGAGGGARAAGDGGGRIQCVSFCSSRPASHWLQSGFSATTKRRLVFVSLCAWNSLEAGREGGALRLAPPLPAGALSPPRAAPTRQAPVRAASHPLLRSRSPPAPGAVSAVDDGVVGGVHRPEVVLGLFHDAAALARLGAPLGLRGVCEGQSASALPIHRGQLPLGWV